MSKPRIIAIAGPTASGKSDLALRLAQKLNGEIVCMDSMQIYRRMDIGTAKPTAQEQQAVAHHMLDIVEPTENYAVADYARDAESVIYEILSRGKQPILTGGTGLYLKALMHGLTLGGAGSDEKLREKLNALALEPGGKEQLHDRLAKVDPVSAQKLHPNDIRRVIRAIDPDTDKACVSHVCIDLDVDLIGGIKVNGCGAEMQRGIDVVRQLHLICIGGRGGGGDQSLNAACHKSIGVVILILLRRRTVEQKIGDQRYHCRVLLLAHT